MINIPFLEDEKTIPFPIVFEKHAKSNRLCFQFLFSVYINDITLSKNIKEEYKKALQELKDLEY